MGTAEPCNPSGGQMRILVCPLGPGFLSLRLSNWNFSWICFDSWDWVYQHPCFLLLPLSLTQCQKQRLVRPNVTKNKTSKLAQPLMCDLLKQKQALCLELIKIHLYLSPGLFGLFSFLSLLFIQIISRVTIQGFMRKYYLSTSEHKCC